MRGVNIHSLSIWANNVKDPEGRSILQVCKAIHYYEKLLKNPKQYSNSY